MIWFFVLTARTATYYYTHVHTRSLPDALPFYRVVADNLDAYVLVNRGKPDSRVVEVMPVPAGLAMLTAYDLNDPASPRDARHRAAFEAAPAPDPWAGDWAAWQAILARDRKSTRLNSSN